MKSLDNVCLWVCILVFLTAYIPWVPVFIIIIWATFLFSLAVQERGLGRRYDRRSAGIDGEGRIKNEAA